MVPSGSIVQIDTRNRAISSRNNWTHEFRRSVYFLRDLTRVCLWLVRIGRELGMADPDPSRAIAYLQPKTEVSGIDRKPRARYLRSQAVGG
jgi:hypothetical protein